MDEKGIKWSDVSLIVITHGHHDHFGSAAYLKERIGAPLAVHVADREYLNTGVNPPLHPIGLKGAVACAVTRMVKSPAVRKLEADILIEGEMDLLNYGISGRIIPTPGHTRGSISVFLDGGCAIVGDLIMGGIFRRKSPGLPYFGYNRKGILGSIKKVLDLNPKIIYAGHGGPFTIDSVRRKFFG